MTPAPAATRLPTVPAARCGAALAVLAMALILCAPAAAAPTWLAPVSLSATGQNATLAQVGVDAQGNSVAIWQHADPGSEYTVEAAVRPAGGAWQATPTDLATCQSFPPSPQIAVDARGDAVAAWRCLGTSGFDFTDASVRPAGGAWATPVALSDPTAGVEAPQVAIDGQGDALVVWARTSGASVQMEAATRPAGAAWQPGVALSSTSTFVSPPHVAMTPGGAATAVWMLDDGTGDVIQAATLAAGASSWGPAVNLTNPGSSPVSPRVAMSPQGDAIAVWPTTAGGTTVQAAVRAAGGPWGPPVDLSVPGQTAENPAIAIDPAGDATAVWDRSNGANTIVEAAQRPVAGSWQPPADLSSSGQSATNAGVAVDSRGDAIAVWQRSNGANTIIQAARRPTGGTWQPASDLSAAGENAESPAVAVDPLGDATAVWDRSDGTDTIVQAAGLDAAGPRLDGLSVPATAPAGTPVAFAVSPLDVWSPVAGSAWAFGDGQTATGNDVTHTYATAGRYPVSESSTDALGNATTATATITITARPGAGTTPTSGSPPAPTLTRISETHRTWRERTGKPTGRRRVPTGTSFAFTLNERSRVTLTFVQNVTGRRVASRCQAPTRRNRHHATCRRTVLRGTLTLTSGAGAHHVSFLGRIGRHTFPLGAYTVDLSAVNAATHRRSSSHALHFTIVR